MKQFESFLYLFHYPITTEVAHMIREVCFEHMEGTVLTDLLKQFHIVRNFRWDYEVTLLPFKEQLESFNTLATVCIVLHAIREYVELQYYQKSIRTFIL